MKLRKELYGEFARIGKAMSNPHRLELLDLLCQGERTVEVLANEASLSVANASQHLRNLRAARLVESRREGSYVYYRVADEAVYRFWRELQRLGKRRLAEVNRLVRDYIESRDVLEPVNFQLLLEKMNSGDVNVIDVRPRAEYEAGHIAGARSVPLDEIEEYVEKLPSDREIVAYCRGPYCVLAADAVGTLREHGFDARRLQEGFPEWRSSGLPVASEHSTGSHSAEDPRR